MKKRVEDVIHLIIMFYARDVTQAEFRLLHPLSNYLRISCLMSYIIFFVIDILIQILYYTNILQYKKYKSCNIIYRAVNGIAMAIIVIYLPRNLTVHKSRNSILY